MALAFSDIGKAAKDLFEKNYHFGVIKLDHKTVSSNGFQMKVSGSQKIESSEVFGNLEGVYKFPGCPTTFTGKWNTKNELLAGLCVDDYVKGLKNTSEFEFEPNTGKRSLKFKNNYKNELLNASLDAQFLSMKPKITSNLVVSCSKELGYMGGIDATFDSSQMNVSKYAYAVACCRGDFAVTAMLTDHNEIMGTVYQRVNNSLETGVKLVYDLQKKNPIMGLAAKYQVDPNVFVKVKASNDSIFNLAYGFQIRKGVDLTVCTQIDGKDIYSRNHQFGFAMEFSA